MASPASNGANEDAEDVIGSTVISSSQRSGNGIEYDCGSAPPSPEIGMGNPSQSEIGDLELDGVGRQTAADAYLYSVEQQNDDAVSKSESEEHIPKLPRRHPSRKPSPQSACRASPYFEGTQLMPPAPTCPPTRRSARAKSTLMYDQKYHPMDDIIRPSQAAKRRSLHGEQPVLGSDSDSQYPQNSDSDGGSMVGDEDSDDEESQQPTQGHKRKRPRSRHPEPTRRSSRRRTRPKVSYNMKIHPQDSDLKRVWACDGSKSSPSPTNRVSSNEANFSTKKTPSGEFEEACASLLVDKSEGALRAGNSTIGRGQRLSSSALSAGSTPEPFPGSLKLQTPAQISATRKGDIIVKTYLDLCPDIAYRSTRQDVWPDVKGLPFQIFTERIEDQLSTEAEAASPFHYEDDEKENNVTNPELIPRLNPPDDISIIPASHYRRALGPYTTSSHSSMASNAFYAHPQFEASPYGLGWSDGAHDIHNSGTTDRQVSDYMRIIASSEHLPQEPAPAGNGHSRRDNNVVSSSPDKGVEGLECLR